MITTRRSFVKGLAFALGSIPLPGVVKDALGKLAPEEQTLEDAEAILRGLIARVANGPIDEQEARLCDSFLGCMPATEEQIAVATGQFGHDWRRDFTEEQMQDLRRKLPYVTRFIVGVTKQTRNKPWFSHNFKQICQKTKIMHKLVRVYDPTAKVV